MEHLQYVCVFDGVNESALSALFIAVISLTSFFLYLFFIVDGSILWLPGVFSGVIRQFYAGGKISTCCLVCTLCSFIGTAETFCYYTHLLLVHDLCCWMAVSCRYNQTYVIGSAAPVSIVLFVFYNIRSCYFIMHVFCCKKIHVHYSLLSVVDFSTHNIPHFLYKFESEHFLLAREH